MQLHLPMRSRVVRTRTTFVEVCAGSCSVSAHLLGWTMQPTAWLGTKWRHRHHLEALARGYGLVGVPRCIAFDAGPIAEIAPQLMRSARARELARDMAADILGPLGEPVDRVAQAMSKGPDGAAFKARCLAMQGPPPVDPDERAAFGALLIGASFGGMGLAERDGRWVMDRTGRSPSSVRAVRSRARMSSVPIDSERRANARPRDLPPDVHPADCVVLLDPPYDRRTGYADDMPREVVRELAAEWLDAGAAVLLTEAEPVMGWRVEPLRGDRSRSGLSIAELVEHASA
jgi:hypothetical protein